MAALPTPYHTLNADDITTPFSLTIADNGGAHTMGGERVLRLLPGRRIVFRGTWQKRAVLAKLFIHPRKSNSDYQQELSGHQQLQTAEILTPQILLHGRLDNGGFFILYEYIDNAIVLGELLTAKADDNAISYCRALMTVIAAMHAGNMRQIDLHVNNFLVGGTKIYAIDCGEIAPLSTNRSLRAKQIITNLADILSQLPLNYDTHLEDFISHYQTTGNTITPPDSREISKRIYRWRRWRMNNYVKKAARTCSEFIASTTDTTTSVHRRDHSSKEWLELYTNIDTIAEQETRLKDGGSATVAVTTCAGERVVIKRYNIKNKQHWLSRCWRPSRAWRTWCNAQRLQVLGINTPLPIAVIETRRLGLRHKAYYVSSYTDAPDLLGLYSDADTVAEHHLTLVQQFFAAMRYARISHGDFKANNILIDKQQLHIIDLDAMCFHRCRWRFNRAFARDMRRFMRNWRQDSNVYKQFEKIISK